MDERKWEEEALNTCLPGICAKFHQNTNVMDTLLNKTGMKRIAECTSDQLLGTGIPLGDPDCLDQTKWIFWDHFGANPRMYPRRVSEFETLLSSASPYNCTVRPLKIREPTKSSLI